MPLDETISIGQPGHITDHQTIAAALNSLTTDGDILTRTAGAPARLTRAALAADAAFTGTFVPLASVLEGTPLYIYGHSMALGQVAYNNYGWAARVARRLGMQLVNRAVGGEVSAQTAGRLIGTVGSSPWVAGTPGVVVFECAINDVRLYGNTGSGLNEMTHSLRSMIATVGASSRVEQSAGAFVYTGTWTQGNSYAESSGGTNAYTTTQNDYVDYTFTGDACTIMLLVLASGTLGVDFTVGASTRSKTYVGESTGTTKPAVSITEVFTGFGAGSHTMRIKKTDATASNLFVDCALIPSTTPPKVYLLQEDYLPTASYALNSPYNQGSDAAVVAYNAKIVALAAEFPSYCTALASTGWNRDAMTATGDGIHPNDQGHAVKALPLATALLALSSYAAGVNIT